MKIAMLIDGWDPVVGGGQTYVRHLCEHLVRDFGCEVDLFVRKLLDERGNRFDRDESLFDGKWKIFRLGPTTQFFNLFGRLANLALTTFVLYRKTKREKYDIIHAHAYVDGMPAEIVGCLCRVPVVYTVHGTMNLDAGKTGILVALERFLITKIRYDLEISVSRNIFRYENVNKSIAIIPPGVDMDRFTLLDPVPKYDGISFLFVGRFDWQKGIDVLIRAVSLLNREMLRKKGFRLNLVGDGLLRPDIESLVAENELEEFVFFHGKLLGNMLVDEYRRNHVFVLPSLAEGQPIVVFEAWSSKLPVIATDAGDNKHYIRDGENGYVVPVSDIEELSRMIEKVLHTDKAKLSEMGESGYRKVEKELTWRTITDRIWKEYGKLLSN